VPRGQVRTEDPILSRKGFGLKQQLLIYEAGNVRQQARPAVIRLHSEIAIIARPCFGRIV
jgi:hypothetical protein